MHAYSIDSSIRRNIYVGLGFFAFMIPTICNFMTHKVSHFFTSVPNLAWPLSFATTFGVLYFVFDRYMWKWKISRSIHKIPNLEGVYSVKGLSSYELDETTQAPKYCFNMEIKIKQSFSRIEVFSESNDSTSRSTLAGFCMDHAVGLFRYSFENTPKNKSNPELQRHPGLIELRIKDNDELQGDYFSGKHRLRYGELTLRRKNNAN